MRNQIRSASFDFSEEEENMSSKTAVRLLIAASVLMVHAGGIFAFQKLWLCAALLGAGALGCIAGAISFKNLDGKK